MLEQHYYIYRHHTDDQWVNNPRNDVIRQIERVERKKVSSVGEVSPQSPSVWETGAHLLLLSIASPWQPPPGNPESHFWLCFSEDAFDILLMHSPGLHTQTHTHTKPQKSSSTPIDWKTLSDMTAREKSTGFVPLKLWHCETRHIFYCHSNVFTTQGRVP